MHVALSKRVNAKAVVYLRPKADACGADDAIPMIVPPVKVSSIVVNARVFHASNWRIFIKAKTLKAMASKLRN